MSKARNPMAAILKESGDIFLISGIGGIVLLMILPIPPFLLDVLLVASISFSVLILLVSFYSHKPMDFSVFPTMLLLATLSRLALNIASTRIILLHGSEGENAAGDVIHAFGYFVVGGNYVVGFIVFAILVIINFVVITKGAGRIAEVSARFTLDAMPGKQLAIDADLNAGIINDKEAIRRREEIAREADFYGSMDGASKFVRGDAVAGIMITLVNVIGGFVIGVAQQGLPFTEALKIYTTLTVGDGLVSQIPALIISVAAGLIVTKVSNNKKLSEEIGSQAFRKWRPLAMASVVLLFMAIIPGFPVIPFLFMSILMGGGGYLIWRAQNKIVTSEASIKTGEKTEEIVARKDEGIPTLDSMEVEVGYDLIPIVDQRSGGDLPVRIIGIRKQLASEMGIVLPPVHIRDNLKLKPSSYRILLKGAVIGEGDLLTHHHLALDSGMTTRKIDGLPTTDPTFGLPAIWVQDEQKESAIVAGYTIVDLPSVMATHVMEIVRKNLRELFGRQDLATLLDRVKLTHPRVVSDLIPDLLPFGTILKVLQNLLQERVSIRDIVTILESLAEYSPITKDPGELTEHVRVALGRSIAQQHAGSNDTLYAITLDRALEEKLIRSLGPSQSGANLAVDPNMAKSLVEQLGNETKKNIANNQPPVVLTSQQIRPYLYRLIERFIPNLAVLAHSEVAGHISVKPVGMIGAIP